MVLYMYELYLRRGGEGTMRSFSKNERCQVLSSSSLSKTCIFEENWVTASFFRKVV